MRRARKAHRRDAFMASVASSDEFGLMISICMTFIRGKEADKALGAGFAGSQNPEHLIAIA
ncbi:hypothetical protein MRBLMR1_004371 [Neorhizobium sp. LMR1-1-1.1]